MATDHPITAEWLTSVLAPGAPGLVIEDVALVDTIPGASTKVRAHLRTNRNDFPGSIIVKAGLEPHSGHMRGMHDNEMHAYRDLIPTLEVNAPRCLYAGPDWNGHSMVVLEDLDARDVHFLALQRPIGFDLARRFLDGLAKIHARWWDSPALREPLFAWVPDTSEEVFHHYFDIMDDAVHFGRFIASPRGAAMPVMFHDAARIRAAHRAMRRHHETMPLTISHGDMHIGNLYTDADGRPGFLDWQPRLAPWSIDTSYFITAALDLVDRRRWEGALLQHYLEQLAANGVQPPGFDEAWAAYRRDLVWGLLIWLLNGTQFQSESRNTAAATRFAMAMVDHDTYGLLGV